VFSLSSTTYERGPTLLPYIGHEFIAAITKRGSVAEISHSDDTAVQAASVKSEAPERPPDRSWLALLNFLFVIFWPGSPLGRESMGEWTED
jgi:hypothetical protein